eukprot:CAMPEP_0203877496 /NCGR_PEP_ID=MMETSP0359-20131031/22088_1 /ASSEMBLY_ACC=CAM_ASM_000338 /TAXON_ID=268821 /ORGANISM="Scrippsiella Hangoei, Strain SHTV-5" /LENGTH=461 /DNA_ID=CAMNT_0050796463 /DNA_START=126 /DNA_END=1511 /DNA_ORIENTATION=-
MCMRPLVLVLGSPKGIRRLHKLLMMETILALPVMLLHMFMLVMLAGHLLTIHGIIVMMAVVVLPVVLTGLRMPSLIRIHKGCAVLVQAYESDSQPIADRMMQLLWCRASQDQRLFSLLLVGSYALGLTWQSRKVPCNGYFIELESLTMECHAFRVSCTVLVAANALLITAALLAPLVVCRCSDNFTPPSRRGIPKELLDRLPIFVWEADSTTAAECVVCFGDFEAGESLRRLPCGHEFHAECIDGWLCNNPSCPMRCASDIWQVVRAAADSSSSSAAPLEDEDRVLDEMERGPANTVSLVFNSDANGSPGGGAGGGASAASAAPAVVHSTAAAAAAPAPVVLGLPRLVFTGGGGGRLEALVAIRELVEGGGLIPNRSGGVAQSVASAVAAAAAAEPAPAAAPAAVPAVAEEGLAAAVPGTLGLEGPSARGNAGEPSDGEPVDVDGTYVDRDSTGRRSTVSL